MKKIPLFLAFVTLLTACVQKPTPEYVEVLVLVTQPPPPTYTPYPTKLNKLEEFLAHSIRDPRLERCE